MSQPYAVVAALCLLILTSACAPNAETSDAAQPETAETSSPNEAPDAAASAPSPAAPNADQTLFTSAGELLQNGSPARFDVILFYLHGRIIEEGDRRPQHPEFGIYEYDQVLEALAVPGSAVISEARAEGTEPAAYAAKVATEIGELLAAGARPEQITVIGFSKGGFITLQVSHQLGHDDVGFVVLAGCGSWLDELNLELRGRMLSIYEKSDRVGSCKPWVERSSSEPFFHEIEIAIGGSHGAFYSPQAEWLDQVLLWTGAESIRQRMTQPERIDG